MTKPNIAFVDDDKFFAMQWVDELQEIFEVHYFEDAAQCVAFVKSTSTLNAIVIDMMMPIPKGVAAHEVANGLETGLWVLRELDEFLRLYPLPVVFMTNLEPDRLSEIEIRIAEMKFPLGLIHLRRKMKTDETELSLLLRTLVAKWYKSRP